MPKHPRLTSQQIEALPRHWQSFAKAREGRSAPLKSEPTTSPESPDNRELQGSKTPGKLRNGGSAETRQKNGGGKRFPRGQANLTAAAAKPSVPDREGAPRPGVPRWPSVGPAGTNAEQARVLAGFRQCLRSQPGILPSLAETAAAAEVDLATCRRCLLDLCRSGWLTRVRADRGGPAAGRSFALAEDAAGWLMSAHLLDLCRRVAGLDLPPDPATIRDLRETAGQVLRAVQWELTAGAERASAGSD